MASIGSHRGRNRFKVLVTVLAPIVSLLLIEAGFRYRAWVRSKDTLSEAFSVPRDKPSFGRTRFLDIIQPNSNDSIIYELRPSLDVVYKGKPLRTNSHGFRGPEYDVEADEGTLTIVGIGASIMFGHGVGNGEEYSAILERELNRRVPAAKWRFVNTSAPSYNVVMKVETLRTKGLRFEPDLVILNIAGNNLELPNYVRLPEDPLDFKRSFLLDFFSGVRKREEETEKRDAVLARVDKSKLSWGAMVSTNPEEIPPSFRHLVGWDPFYAAMDHLKRLSEEHGFEVIVFTTLDLDITSKMLREGEARGFHAVSLMDDLVEYMEERDPEGFSLERYAKSELVVSAGNLHPSVIQHRMAARRLLTEMQRLGVIERLLTRN
ncbi:MAG: hypothetical protein O7B99_03335 [Planctomycetota bacterium]|nr:hypothetical protein [Planctomycetota bacterium]